MPTEPIYAILARAGDRCEQCGVRNHAVGFRDAHGLFHEFTWGQKLVDGARAPKKGDTDLFRIVLTISHTDHDTTHNTDDNLLATCQRCHLRHDAALHQAHAAETRRRKRIAAGQGALLGE